MKLDYIIIDDSELDGFIAKKLVLKLVDEINHTIFLTVKEALNCISTNKSDADLTIILLDLMLPEMNGFYFIESFQKLPEEVQQAYYIVVMTSSMNRIDINRLKNFTVVQEILDKPVTMDSLSSATRLALSGFRKRPV